MVEKRMQRTDSRKAKEKRADISEDPRFKEGTMNPELLHILQHSLGVDKYGRGNQYRNRFVTGPETTDFPKCIELVGLELMKDHGPQSIAAGDHCFTVTEKGKVAMHMNSPEPPKLSKSQVRYRRFLNADSGLSFKEWLKYESTH